MIGLVALTQVQQVPSSLVLFVLFHLISFYSSIYSNFLHSLISTLPLQSLSSPAFCDSIMSSGDKYNILLSPHQGSKPPHTSPPVFPSYTGPTLAPLGLLAHHPCGEDWSPVLPLQEGHGCKRPAKDMTQFVD